jgi:Zn-dependent peptidase ImmA (M78 family)
MLQVENQGREEMAKVPVNGKVLKWAREIRGLTIDDAAILLGISASELRSYESGSNLPLVGLLRRMSAKYQINFTTLLMPAPLPTPKRPIDHRSHRGRQRLTLESLVAIEEITEALDIFQDIAAARRKLIPRLNIGSANVTDDPETVAARERKRLGVTIEQQRMWRGLGDARRKWRERVEEHGVFTYMMPMPLRELSGFSILRKNIAAICINDREPTEGAKIFTLFHEYGHLLLRQAGISDEKDTNRIERFCNNFAACFLIPRDSLKAAIEDVQLPNEFSDAEVKRLATRFRVSNRAIALRLEKTGLAPEGFYGRRTAPWDVPVERVKPAGDTQPSAIRIRLKQLGHLHASIVMEALKRHAINSVDAAQLIGLQPTTFPKVVAAIG